MLCKVLKISRSGFYNWENRKICKIKYENAKLIPVIRKIHVDCGRIYGSRRMSNELKRLDYLCGRKRTITLIRMANIEVGKL